MRQTAIVTGASRGTGLTVVHQPGLDGHHVIVFATKPKEDYMEHLRMLQKADIGCWYIQNSLGKTGDRRNLVDKTVARYSCINMLVSNARVAPPAWADLLEMIEESYGQVMSINTKGTMFLIQLVIKQMLKQEMIGKKRETIANVGSCSVEVSSTDRREYCISESVASMIIILFADRLAGERILAHEVHLDVIKTNMTSRAQGKCDSLVESGSSPIRQWGMPQDVADAVGVFCSDKFSYITGNRIDIDSGLHIERL